MHTSGTVTESYLDLQAMIDAHGLLHVLAGLELVCDEKAERLRVNWQDHTSARHWDAASKICRQAADKYTRQLA